MTGRERFGPTLRRIREQRGITLAQLADTTNVDVEMWEALERNDFSRWPTGIFARAFVREYARAIGVEPESTVDEFCRLFPHGDRRREAIIRAEAERLGLAPDWHDDLTPARDRRRQSEQASTVDVARAALLARRARLAAGGFDLGVVTAGGLLLARAFHASPWPCVGGLALVYHAASLLVFGASGGAALVTSWLHHSTAAELRRLASAAFPKLRRNLREARG